MILLDLLATLDAVELATFEKHLQTAHPKEQIALRAFAHFKQFHPHFADGAQLDLDFVVRKLQRQKVVGMQFNRKQLSNTCSDLYGWLKDFLLLKKAKDKSLESEYLWLTVLRERGMVDAQERAEAALFGRVWSAPKQDVWDYCWNMATHYAACFESKNKQGSEADEAIEALNACRVALDQFYGACRHKVNCELLNWSNQEGGTIAVKQMGNEPPGEPLVRLYGMVEALFSGGGMAEYEALEAALVAFSKMVATSELHRVWIYLKNYNTRLEREGDQAAWARAHRLDRFAWQHGLFQRMSPLQFLNVINAAANLGEYEWSASFIAYYVAGKEENMRYEARILANAIQLFSQKKYEEVSQQLKKFDGYGFREPHFAIRYRTLNLMSMYELELDHATLRNEAVNFEASLRRSESPWKDAAKATLDFLRFYKKLFLAKPKAEQILADIRAAKSLVFRTWLLEKFEHYRLVE